MPREAFRFGSRIHADMFGAWVSLPIRILKLWLLAVGLVAFLAAPLECYHATLEVTSRLFKLLCQLPKHYYVKAVAYYYFGVEL